MNTGDIIKEVDILLVESGVPIYKKETVVVENTVHLCLNGRRHAVLTAIPQNIEELVLGHLLSSGSIRKLADVKQLTTDSELQTVQVETAGGKVMPMAVADGLCMPLDDILTNMDQFLRKSSLFTDTGAVHSCALIVDGQLLHFMEDIGRHNAFDKTIGAALLKKTPLDRAAVLTSGRVPKDMMLKIIQSQLQIVASRSAPTDSAIRLALRNNVTLCGFTRRERINIYSGRQRIIS